jgi:NADPH2:quinone reductase
MSFAIRVAAPGGPEALQYTQVAAGKPGPGEALIRHTAIGLNFIDVYQRTGLYPVPPPFTPGGDAAGVVEEVGAGTNLQPGDRVAYVYYPPGAYAQHRVMPANRLVKLPDSISDEQAAAIMLKGITSEYLLRRTYKVSKGETILFHAAAGGVGLIACQWAKHLGATVIGTAGSDEKLELARQHGCDHVINYKTENFVERVKDITNGEGVPVVYDSVGQATFEGSIDCLRPRGMMVSFGNASGPIPPFEPLLLSRKGSLFFTRPSLGSYIITDEEYHAAAKALFDVVESGAVKIVIGQRYALKDAPQAHRDLEARKTTGSTLLIP